MKTIKELVEFHSCCSSLVLDIRIKNGGIQVVCCWYYKDSLILCRLLNKENPKHIVLPPFGIHFNNQYGIDNNWWIIFREVPHNETSSIGWLFKTRNNARKWKNSLPDGLKQNYTKPFHCSISM